MKNVILIVDDMEVNRMLLRKLFCEDYHILEAKDGFEAVATLKAKHDEICMVLLDIVMPGMDGFGVLDFMGKADMLSSIPVVLITGDVSKELKHRGYDTGVSDIITKPFDSYLVKKRVNNIIDLYFHKNKLEELLDEKMIEIRNQNKLLNDMNIRIVNTLGTIVEFRNLESGVHIMRVREFTKILLHCVMQYYPEYGIQDDEVEMICNASALHDVGKITIPDMILLKPGKLTADEFEIMKCHTSKGYDIIEKIFDPSDHMYLKYCEDIALYHHEKYDGKGYPEGLRGDEIPIAAQIVSIADCYDALISERVYKQAYSKDAAYHMILNGECGAFNPKLLQCLEMVRYDLEKKADELI